MENIHGNSCRRAMADFEGDAPGTLEHQSIQCARLVYGDDIHTTFLS